MNGNRRALAKSRAIFSDDAPRRSRTCAPRYCTWVAIKPFLPSESREPVPLSLSSPPPSPFSARFLSSRSLFLAASAALSSPRLVIMRNAFRNWREFELPSFSLECFRRTGIRLCYFALVFRLTLIVKISPRLLLLLLSNNPFANVYNAIIQLFRFIKRERVNVGARISYVSHFLTAELTVIYLIYKY